MSSILLMDPTFLSRALRRIIFFAQEVGNARLMDYKLAFTLANEYQGKGYAGVEVEARSEVWGTLFKLDRFSLRCLDILEWCGFGAYKREKVEVELTGGQKSWAWCYKVKNPITGLMPSRMYRDFILKSAKERSFPQSYIDEIGQFEAADKFEIDYGFSLFFYGKRRPFLKQLKPLYKIHDIIREKLSELI